MLETTDEAAIGTFQLGMTRLHEMTELPFHVVVLRGLVQAAWSPATVTCALIYVQLAAPCKLHISFQAKSSNSSSRVSSDSKHPGLRCSAFLAPPTGWHLWSNLDPRSIPNLVPNIWRRQTLECRVVLINLGRFFGARRVMEGSSDESSDDSSNLLQRNEIRVVLQHSHLAWSCFEHRDRLPAI